MPAQSINPADDEKRKLCHAELHGWVFRQLESEDSEWFADQLNQLEKVSDFTGDAPARRQYDITFGLIPRRVGKKVLQLNADEQKHAQSLLAHWRPWTWRLDEAARILLIVTAGNPDNQTAQIKSLLRHADLSEQLSIFKGLSLFPVDNTLHDVIGEGLRSNMSDVFKAIAHNNPFPANEFDEHRFNHMVLKALFIEAPLHPIIGLRQRNNLELTRMLLDYASERAAAQRTVSWELWQLAAQNADEHMLRPFVSILSIAPDNKLDELSQKGLILALSECSGVSPQQWADENISESITIDSTLSWNTLLLESNGVKH